MRIKRVVIGIVCSLCIGLLSGCNESGQVTQKEEKKIQIGFVFDSFIIERWQRDRDAFVKKAKTELGADVIIENANGDSAEQVRIIDSMIAKKVDTIVVVPVDSDAITDAVKRAKSNGIKVIAYDRLIKNANVDLYITFDNQKVGSLMAKTMKQNVNKNGSVFMMCGPKRDNNVCLVQQGFLDEMKDSSLKVMETKYAAGWQAESGYDELSEYLSSHKSIDAVMCGNDGIAGQVIHALSEHRLAGKVCVVGQDADLEACQRIVEGTQEMTVYKPVTKLASLAAAYAVALAKGETIPTTQVFSDGQNQIPYVGLDPIIITKENMNLLIEDGFHAKEDIYRNVK